VNSPLVNDNYAN